MTATNCIQNIEQCEAIIHLYGETFTWVSLIVDPDAVGIKLMTSRTSSLHNIWCVAATNDAAIREVYKTLYEYMEQSVLLVEDKHD